MGNSNTDVNWYLSVLNLQSIPLKLLLLISAVVQICCLHQNLHGIYISLCIVCICVCLVCTELIKKLITWLTGYISCRTASLHCYTAARLIGLLTRSCANLSVNLDSQWHNVWIRQTARHWCMQKQQWASSTVRQGASSLLLTAKPKHRLGHALFLLQNRFLALILPNHNRSG